MLLVAKQLATARVLASQLNHKVKNTLASVLAGLQALENVHDLSSDDKHVLSLLMDEVRSLNRWMQGALDSVRTDATPFRRISVDCLLAGCMESLGELIRERGVAVQMVPSSGALQVVVDQQAMVRGLSNLVRNAVEASDSGTEVQIGWSILEETKSEKLFPGFVGQVATIYGKDRGAGLPGHIPLEKLFEPFVTTGRSKIGMGLAMAQYIVELHGGVVQLHPRSGGGTRFDVLMPLTQPPACWDPCTIASCLLSYCDLHCGTCKIKAQGAPAPCWAVKGEAYRKKEGVWPRECSACPLFRKHHLPVFVTTEKIVKG